MEKPIIRPFIEKRTGEVFSVGFTFASPELAEGETITDADATVDPSELGGLAVDAVTFTDTEIAVKISAGESGKEYQLLCEATTSAGHTLIGVILVRIIY
uniref:Tail protein n=1 Tax=viral metagenome TaxID=1070528 RepID=A0A6M3LWC0_9ZZZZ